MIITDTYRKNAETLKEIVQASFGLSSESYKKFCEYVDDPMKLFNDKIKKMLIDGGNEVVDFRIPIPTKNLMEEEVPKEIYFINEVLSNILFEFYKDYRVFNNGCTITPKLTMQNKAVIFGKERRIWRFMRSHSKDMADLMLKQNPNVSITFDLDNDPFNIKHLFKFVKEYSRRDRENSLSKRTKEYIEKYQGEISDLSTVTSLIEDTFELTADILGAEISANKDTQKSYLSFNFFDWFLASSGENWTSCIDHGSGTCFSFGLIGPMSCPDWGMLMVTKDREKTYLGIKTPSVLTRSWVVYAEDDSFVIINWYPHEVRNQTSDGVIYEENGIKITTKRDQNNDKGYSWYEPFYLKNGMVPFIYGDNYTLVTAKSGNSIRISFTEDRAGVPCVNRDGTGEFRKSGSQYFGNLVDSVGSNGNAYDHISYGYDIVDLYENDDYSEYHYCACCEDRYHESDLIYVSDFGHYCDSCYNDNFYTCEDCNSFIYYHNDDYVNDNHGRVICQSCYENSYIDCHMCEGVYSTDDSTYVNSVEDWVCEECLKEDFADCDYCGEPHLTTNLSKKTLINNDSKEIVERLFCCDKCREKYIEKNNYTIVEDMVGLEGFVGGKKEEKKEESRNSQVS